MLEDSLREESLLPDVSPRLQRLELVHAVNVDWLGEEADFNLHGDSLSDFDVHDSFGLLASHRRRHRHREVLFSPEGSCWRFEIHRVMVSIDVVVAVLK